MKLTSLMIILQVIFGGNKYTVREECNKGPEYTVVIGEVVEVNKQLSVVNIKPSLIYRGKNGIRITNDVVRFYNRVNGEQHYSFIKGESYAVSLKSFFPMCGSGIVTSNSILMNYGLTSTNSAVITQLNKIQEPIRWSDIGVWVNFLDIEFYPFINSCAFLLD